MAGHTPASGFGCLCGAEYESFLGEARADVGLETAYDWPVNSLWTRKRTMGQLQMNLDNVTADPRMDVTQARPNTDRHRLMAPRHG